MEIYRENTELDGEVHFLERIDDYIERLLCYPLVKCSEFQQRVEALVNDGFIYVLATGARIRDLLVLGKGYSSVVTIAHHRRHSTGALKLLRLDSRRHSLSREAELMMSIEDLNVAPRVRLHRDFYVFYDLLSPIRCKPLVFILNKVLETGDHDELKTILLRVSYTLHQLDMRKIDHTELNRPGNHMLYCEGDLRIIDWESARQSEKPTNLSSFISYLLFRYWNSMRLKRLLGIDERYVIRSLRLYKMNYSEDYFYMVMRSMSLLNE